MIFAKVSGMVEEQWQIMAAERKMRRFYSILMICVLGLCAGCEREQAETPAPPAREITPQEESPEKPILEENLEDEEVTAPAAAFDSWPGREEFRIFELMWLGGEEPLALREEPDREAEILGHATFLDGEQLDWTQTMVLVLEPRPYQAEQAMEWSGLPYDAEYMELEAGNRQFEVEEGELLYLYQYDGEGTCFWALEGEIALGSCPLDGWTALGDEVNESESLLWKPLRQEWWVKIKSGDLEGWFLVEEAPVEVKVRQIEEFDTFDDPEGPQEPPLQ